MSLLPFTSRACPIDRNSSKRDVRRAKSLVTGASIASCLVALTSIATAADGVWTQSVVGLWSEVANWAGGNVADGADALGDFSTLDLLGDAVVQLDSPRTIGRLTFGDTDISTAGGWTLGDNATPANILTLAVSTGSPTITVNALGVGKSATINLELAGTSGLTKAGTGTLTLNGVNTYSGGTVINGGVLAFGSAASISGAGANVTINGGAVAAANYSIDQAFLNRIASGSTGVVALGADSAELLDLSATGANLADVSLGATGAFTYTGTLTPNAGIYRLGGGGGNLTLFNANALTGANSLVVSGVGSTVTLLAANDFTGAKTINSGTLQLANVANVLGTGAITLNGGTLMLNGGGTVAPVLNAVSITADSVITGGSGGNFEIRGNITGSSVLSFAIPGGRTFTAGSNSNVLATYTGTIALGSSAGTFRFQSGGTLDLVLGSTIATFDAGNATATFQARNRSTINLGALVGGSGTFLRGPGSTDGLATYVIGANNASTTFAGTILDNTSARNVAITKTGSGTLKLTGTNTFTGATVVNNGILQIGDGGTIGTLGAATSVTVTSPGTLAFNRSDDVTLTKLVSGTGGLRQVGPGNLIIAAANTYSGPTTIAGGTLRIDPGGALGTTSGVSNDGTLAFNRSDAVAFSPAITGTGGVRLMNAASTVTLSGANTYTGPTVIDAGTLLLTGSLGNTAVAVNNTAKLFGTGPIGGSVTVNSGGTLSPGDNSVSTLSLGGLSLNAGAILNFEFNATPANDQLVLSTLDGLTINGGGFNLFTAGSTDPWLAPGTYNLIQYTGAIGGIGTSTLSVLNQQPGGYTYSFDANGSFVRLTISSPVQPNSWNIDASGVWSTATNWSNNTVPAAGAVATFPGVITAPRTVTLDGSRTVGGLNFTSLQSYTIAAQPGSTLTLDNGAGAATIDVPVGSHTISAPLALTANGTAVFVGAGATLTTSGEISQTAPSALTKSGAGLLVLSGTNSYSGGTQITGGAIQFASLGNLGTGGITFNGGGLRWAPASTADVSARTLTFGSGGATLDTNGNDVTLANPIGNNGAGGLTKTGLGTLNLSGLTNTYTGVTSFNGGAVQFDSLNNFGTGNLVFNGGTLRWALGSFEDISTRTVTINAGGAVLDTNGTFVVLVSPIGNNGAGGLTKTGDGTLILSSPPAYAGSTTISGGSLSLGAPDLFPTTATVVVEPAGTFDLAGLNQTLINIGGTGTVALNGGNLALGGTDLSTTFAGSLAGGGTLNKVTNGTLVLTGVSTTSATVNVNSGLLRLDPGGSLTAGAFNTVVNSGAQVYVHGGSLVSSARSILNNASAGFLIDDGTAAFNGGIQMGGDNGSTIRVNGGIFTASDVNIPRNGGVAPNFGSGFIVANGAATVGTVRLGTNNSTGAMSIEGGSLTVTGAITVANQQTPGRGGGMRVTGGTFISTDTVDGLVLVRNHATAVGQVASATFSGGTSTIERITFGFDEATAAGSTATVTINGGTVYLGSGGVSQRALETNLTSIFNLTSGLLGASADWTSTVPMTLPLGNTLVIQAADASNAPHTITLSGPVGGEGQLTKTGAGTLVLAGANAYTGGTTISTGKLQVGAGGISGSLGAGTVANSGVLAFNRSDAALEVANTISGSGSLEQNGTGATTLTRDNSYTGETILNSGILFVKNLIGSATGSGAVTVKNSATLGGLGSVAGAVALQSGGTLAPGIGVGNLTVGTLALSAGSILGYEFNSTGRDLTVVSGAGGLTINGGGFNLYEENTTNPWLVAGTYNLFQTTGAIGGTGVTALSVLNGDPAHYNYNFSTSGNFVRLSIAVIPLANSWNVDASGPWSTAGNWTNSTVPAAGAVVNFPGVITQPRTVTLDGSRSVGGLSFYASQPQTIAPGSGSLTLDNGATAAAIDVSAGSPVISAPLTLTAAGSVATINNGASLTLSGGIGQTGPAVLTKSGGGTLVLSGNNSHSGGTVFNAGTLHVNSASALGSGPFTLNGGSLANSSGAAVVLSANNTQSWNADVLFNGPNDLNLGTGAVTMSAARTVTVGAGELTVGGPISGAGSSLTKAGPGTLTLVGASSYSGGTVLSAGALNVNAASALGTGPLTINGGALGNTKGSPVVLTTNNAQSWNADFTFNGPSDLDLGSGAVTLSASRQVTVAAGNLAVSSIGGAGAGLTKNGPGGLILNGASSYDGPTEVSGGTFIVSGQLSGTSSVHVASGATLGGAGSITTPSGSVTLDGGAFLAPGNSAGTLTMDLGFGSLDVGGPAAVPGSFIFELGTTSDKVVLTGISVLNVGFSGLDLDDFSFTDAGGFGPGTYTLFETGVPINGNLGFNLVGQVLGFDATLSFGDGTDVVLTVVPEPGAAASLLGGLAVLLGLRRRR